MLLSAMTFVSSTESVVEIRVVAKTGVVNEDTNRADLTTVQAEWAAADGKPSLEITCNTGQLDLATNDLVANGNVHGLLADGRRFIGPSLRYDRARGVAYTSEPVQIFEGPRVFKGAGFEYRIRDRRLRFTSGAQVEENPQP